jgi:glutamyl-tRNA reductase
MSLVIMGASFKSAPITVREKIAVPAAQVPSALVELTANAGVDEALVLSTCNRVEAYVNAKTDRLGSDALEAFFRARCGDGFDRDAFYLHRGMDTVQHVNRVVCSLDSQLLGEAQILGQMRTAFEMATDAGTAGEVLTHLFKSALHLGKKVRSETAIGSDSVSLSTTAFKVAKDSFDDLQDRRILIVGTGEMAGLCATYLVDAGIHDVLVTSRTPEHATEFAERYGARAIPFDELTRAAASCDVIFTMTSSPNAVLTAKELEQARHTAKTEGQKLVVVDEAVPRDVDPEVGKLDGVELYNLESLASIVDEGMAQRMSAVGTVERMVEEANEEFFIWMQQRLVTPTIKDIHAKGEAIVEGELVRAEKALSHTLGAALTKDQEDVLRAYGNAIANKILHGPTARLRKESTTADSYYYTGAARYLFGIDAFPVGSGIHHTCVGIERCPAGGCSAGRALAAHEIAGEASGAGTDPSGSQAAFDSASGAVLQHADSIENDPTLGISFESSPGTTGGATRVSGLDDPLPDSPEPQATRRYSSMAELPCVRDALSRHLAQQHREHPSQAARTAEVQD